MTVARTAQEAGPPCGDCRYKTVMGYCSNPAYYEQKFEPSSGTYEIHYSTKVEAARADNGLCGPEALLWEPLSKIKAVRREIGIAFGDWADRHPNLFALGMFSGVGGFIWLLDAL